MPIKSSEGPCGVYDVHSYQEDLRKEVARSERFLRGQLTNLKKSAWATLYGAENNANPNTAYVIAQKIDRLFEPEPPLVEPVVAKDTFGEDDFPRGGYAGVGKAGEAQQVADLKKLSRDDLIEELINVFSQRHPDENLNIEGYRDQLRDKLKTLRKEELIALIQQELGLGGRELVVAPGASESFYPGQAPPQHIVQRRVPTQEEIAGWSLDQKLAYALANLDSQPNINDFRNVPSAGYSGDNTDYITPAGVIPYYSNALEPSINSDNTSLSAPSSLGYIVPNSNELTEAEQQAINDIDASIAARNREWNTYVDPKALAQSVAMKGESSNQGPAGAQESKYEENAQGQIVVNPASHVASSSSSPYYGMSRAELKKLCQGRSITVGHFLDQNGKAYRSWDKIPIYQLAEALTLDDENRYITNAQGNLVVNPNYKSPQVPQSAQGLTIKRIYQPKGKGKSASHRAQILKGELGAGNNAPSILRKLSSLRKARHVRFV